MAAEPKDLRPPAGDHPDGGAADDHPSTCASQKVKLLCSYGGEIIPRPSDGALRYAGGDTRIITVRRDSLFPEIVRKMAEVYGGPTLIRYQFPGEDLDNLISVSTAEDLENMMEEYDKLTQACPDGSTSKLRVFLFSPSDHSTNSSSSSSDIHDIGLCYIEAVNGLEGGVRRKDCIADMSSTQTEAAADGHIEGTPAILSPTAAVPHDPSRLVFGSAGPPVPSIPDAHGSSSVPSSSVQTQILNSGRSEMPSSIASYVPQSHVDPQHADIKDPQSLGMAGIPQPVNILGVAPSHSYAPGMHINMALPTSQVSSTASVQARADTYLEENPSGGRLPKLHSDPNYKLLSQFPPLPPVYLQPQNGEQYGLHPLLPSANGQTARLDFCNFCQKPLPHVHSDTPVNEEHGNASGSAIAKTGPMHKSHHSESMLSLQAMPKIVTGEVADAGVETKAESVVPAAKFGAYWFTQLPEMPHDHERLVLPNAANLDHAKVFVPPVSVGLPGDKQASYGMLTSPPQSHREDILQQQLPETMRLPRYTVKQDVISKPSFADAGLVGKSSSQGAGQLVQDSVPALSHDHVKTINGMMEVLRAGPPEQWKPTVPPDIGIPNDLRSKNSPLVVENSHLIRPQVGGNMMPTSNDFFTKCRIFPEENTSIPAGLLPSTALDVTHMHNVQLPNNSGASTMIGNNGAYPYYLETMVGPVIPSEKLFGEPKYCHVNDFTCCGNSIHKIPNGDCRSEDPQFHPNEVTNDASITISDNSQLPLSTSRSHCGNEEQLPEKFPLDSLFCNEDPWKIVGNMHGLLPRVPSKESDTMDDFCTGDHSVNGKGSHISIVIEEGGLHDPQDSLNKDLCMEPVQPMKGDEQIKKDVGTFTERVVASTRQSSEPPVPDFFAPEPMEYGPPNKGSGTIETNLNTNDHNNGVIMPKQSQKIFLGFPIADDLGHLQIIKNSDLEELQELGSGMFGTVYHGKWRGSDVAIKRINDRYFSGKPSEQERMMADFWNEVCKLADMHHPNIVALYGVVLDGPGGSIATVTEYMVNGSLRHALQKKGKPLDQRRQLQIAMDAAFGMEYLHSKEIIHFDLKSDNLLVNLRDPQRPICKVCDLGLSKVKRQTLISGGVRGTLPYMAPEVLHGDKSLVSEKIDVFSFGIVMWELLTGEEPYEDLHDGAILGGILSNTLRPPVPDSCDPDWRTLMEQCWSAEASERPSFVEIATRLRSMAASRPQD